VKEEKREMLLNHYARDDALRSETTTIERFTPRVNEISASELDLSVRSLGEEQRYRL